MSETPRTDAVLDTHLVSDDEFGEGCEERDTALVDHARTLERELAEARTDMADVARMLIDNDREGALKWATGISVDYTKGYAAILKTPPLTEITSEPLTDTYVQKVPDKCDRIVWRNRYYHLPLTEGTVKVHGE